MNVVGRDQALLSRTKATPRFITSQLSSRHIDDATYIIKIIKIGTIGPPLFLFPAPLFLFPAPLPFSCSTSQMPGQHMEDATYPNTPISACAYYCFFLHFFRTNFLSFYPPLLLVFRQKIMLRLKMSARLV